MTSTIEYSTPTEVERPSELPHRPDFGTKGNKVTLGVNRLSNQHASTVNTLSRDVSNNVYFEPILLTEFLEKHLNINLSGHQSDNTYFEINEVLRGVKISLLLPDGAKITYKVNGLSTEPTSKLMFTSTVLKKEISVVDHYRDKYNIELKYKSLRALQARGRGKRPVYLPIERCAIAAGERCVKQFTGEQVVGLLEATSQIPEERDYNVRQVLKEYLKENSAVDKQFLNELTLVDARVLPSPRLKYDNMTVDPSMGEGDVRNKKLISGGDVKFWTCVNFSAIVGIEFMNEFCKKLVDKCKRKGMVFAENPLIPIRSAEPDKIERALEDILKECEGKKLQLLIIILPDINRSYGKIKRICETKLGIVSQCCRARNALESTDIFFEHMALKINVKVGGRNAVLNDAIERNIPLVTDVPTIIFGDVRHLESRNNFCHSITAVVASMDWPEVTKYRGTVSAQSRPKETFQDLHTTLVSQSSSDYGGMIKELLLAFTESTKKIPERIIFYRDAVSDSQYNQARFDEVTAIKKACDSLNYQGAKVTFVVVKKRRNTRFFPTNDKMDKSGDVLPGTVVDTKICHPTEFDFYLHSHAGLEGTSWPARYHVLYDENNVNADDLQMLTNSLCYTYASGGTSISIVPPVHYARLLACRARYYVEDETSEFQSLPQIKGGTSEFQLHLDIKDNVKDLSEQLARNLNMKLQQVKGCKKAAMLLLMSSLRKQDFKNRV